MKKKAVLLSCFFVLLSIMLSLSITVQAAQTVDIAFDGIRIPVSKVAGTPPTDYSDYPPYYLDVSAEMFNNRTFVPLRLVSELMGADVDWQAPNVLLTHKDTTIKLVVGSKQALKNQMTVTLDAAPYEKGSRTMVPIRFIAESFNCQVEYGKALVNIKTPPLLVGNRQVAKMTKTSRSSESVDVLELKANLFIKNIYQTLFNKHGVEVAEPEHYGNHINLDPLVYYWSDNNEFSLLDNKNNEIAKLIVYEAHGNGLPHPEGTPKYLLSDVTNKKWYVIPDATYTIMQRWNWTASRYGAEGYNTAWHLIKQ